MPPERRTAGTTESGNGRGRVSKRSCNACARCRRLKIKCSGSQPCEACNRRKIHCEFDELEQKILVTRGYLLDLQRKAACTERPEAADCNSPGSAYDRAGEDEPSPRWLDRPAAGRAQVSAADPEPPRRDEAALTPCTQGEGQGAQPPASRLDPMASALTNPLSTGPSTFMAAGDGRSFYLGTSSNWSFTRRVLSMTHEYYHQSPVPTTALLFDGAAYDLKWDGYRTTTGPDTPALPTLDYAIYLINAVKFHCGQMFHLFDDESFMSCLYQFYSDPTRQVEAVGLWYIHFMVVLAFGKAFTAKNHAGKSPPGADFFIKAIQLLPDVNVLVREPVQSTEILCCISLYYQSLDFRHAAHNHIGQAMRIALGQGMHTDMPAQHLGEAHVERCRRSWWTVYVLDREMTSLMGLPQSIHDDDVHPDLPTFSNSVQRTAALNMQIKLSRVIASINRGVYGANRRLNSKFLLSTKEALANTAGLADELQHSFPLHLENTISGVSRTSAYLHLLYHQCVVLATRPLLFCFLKIRLESPGAYADPRNSSETVWNLMKMCIDSSQQMITVLICLQAQGLLETFLPFDLESLSVSTVNILLAPAIDPQLLDNGSLWLHKAYAVFQEMVTAGNVVAEFRKAELQQLDEMLTHLSRPRSRRQSISLNQQPDHEPAEMLLDAPRVGNGRLLSPISGILEELNFSSGLTTAQIMDTANAIESDDTEWMSHAILEHSIW